MDNARIVHVNDNVEGAVYIGRAMPPGKKHPRLAESPFANPFKIGDRLPYTDIKITRDDAIEAYRSWIVDRPHLLARLPELRGKPLACWCRHDGEQETFANGCHGDVLSALLDRYSDDEMRAMAR